MIDEGLLERLRKLGVKSIDMRKDESYYVEFFPRDLLDVNSLVPEDGMPTDRPPPAMGEDGQPNIPPVRIPAAIAAILKRGSVS